MVGDYRSDFGGCGLFFGGLIMLSNKTYDWLKWAAIIAIPAVSTFVSFVFPLWGIPHASEIAQTITAAGTLLGALLGVSAVQYKNGQAD